MEVFVVTLSIHNQGFQIHIVYWTVKEKNLRFLRSKSNRNDVIINLIIILNINRNIKLRSEERRVGKECA